MARTTTSMAPSGGATTEIVAGVAGKRINVWGWERQVKVSAQWKYGSTALEGPVTIAAGEMLDNREPGERPIFTLPDGEGLDIAVGASGAANGFVIWDCSVTPAGSVVGSFPG